ncbi:hypothetical protein D0869_01104 [Hortaea werneckii]|uniref:Mitochondrial import inner membrane translocase subunit TIM54 n=1 Tax=Hortaea werneckii TaxID=91943 RepID=A0A3M6XE82_HORWE|nr:hypothetical protein KC324_g7749 [Hortaea werneckii]KAI7590906.1 hypothetical protein KC316_g3149 [Hortaea werneckii]RMX89145.1 hypothetical protein D0869_01104 [Hortaea werneckii]RMY16178.1 hypothetical protein D0868_00472 [Hortaea werneckii]
MAEKAAASAAENVGSATAGTASGSAAQRPAAPEQNPAFRAMGLPRLRLPSRNWMIFLTVTGSFASAVIYDKWQTKRNRQKWCDLVSHLADEPLSTKTLPRRMTIYLAAPPGDGLRNAREHFHDYIKPVLVSAAMDWDVIEGRKEGDVRHKTAEKIRRKRKRAGEGEAMPVEEAEKEFMVDALREKAGTVEEAGVAGDLVVGRHTWKEYVRGMHEGWLGPADAPKQSDPEPTQDQEPTTHVPGQPSLGDAAVKGAANVVDANTPPASAVDTPEAEQKDQPENKPEEKKEEEEEKPRPRQPPPYITPSEYTTASLSPSTPDMIGPSAGIRFPHILGFRNTPIRLYRFLTRRYLADDIGREVAAAVLANYRSYSTSTTADEDSASGSQKTVPEQSQVLAHEERSWWKTTWDARKEHEESVWIEDMVLDERLASRMRKFELTGQDEDRAKRIGDGSEKVGKSSDTES